ncbi:CBS domain-containing protein [Pelomonas sp. CA6]|uniref:CBS domain-containing protein n=1 Tax=Pelomonas sp. CA6 TaxID=2907999 RepID=UPI001F4BE401|nr:CBS domain-containing protein [Pelomonas sp. CA6]MCH7344777.1 CBS domain-containing protein [Pelomonas sp. CA6]
MKVSEAMSRDVRLVAPDCSLRDAARAMAEGDVGALPVGADDRLVGMITDRDIAVRAVAQGLGPETPVRDVMSADVKYCYEHDELEDVAENMGEIQVRRLPVVNQDKRLVGIVSTADLACSVNPSKTGQAVAGISAPGGSHCQATH